MTNAEAGICMYPNCPRITDRGGLCFLHAAEYKIPKPAKEKVSLSKVSDKRKKESQQRSKMIAEKIKLDPWCVIKSPVCTGLAQTGDHVQKSSPANYAEPDNNVPVCFACNLYKELYPLWAEENGHAISRFQKAI